MILPLVVFSSLLMIPVKDTVWWNTPGGQVMEHRDAADASCSLMLYNHDGSVVFQWDSPTKTQVTAIDWSWQFPNDWKLPVAMQLGDVWLSNGGNSVIIPAVGHGNTVSFLVNQSVDDLLRPAGHVAIRTVNAQLSIKLNPAKIDVLLSHARQCRDAIRK